MAKRGRPRKTKVDEILQTNYMNLPATADLFREFIKISNIEKCKEEGFVLREMLKGKKPNEIIKALRRKHPDYYFDHNDFNRFLERNKEIRDILEKENKVVARRFKAARAEVEEIMKDLLLFNKELIRDLYNKEDDTNLIAAIRALNQTIMNYAKLAGYLDESEKRNVNIVNLISDRFEGERLRDRIHRADFKEDVIVVETPEEDEERRKETTDGRSKDHL